MKCRFCGTEINHGSPFCYVCGCPTDEKLSRNLVIPIISILFYFGVRIAIIIAIVMWLKR